MKPAENLSTRSNAPVNWPNCDCAFVRCQAHTTYRNYEVPKEGRIEHWHLHNNGEILTHVRICLGPGKLLGPGNRVRVRLAWRVIVTAVSGMGFEKKNFLSRGNGSLGQYLFIHRHCMRDYSCVSAVRIMQGSILVVTFVIVWCQA